MNDVKVERITAPNGSVFTGAGTNTYLVGENDISIVVPGPNIKSHLDKKSWKKCFKDISHAYS